MASDYLIPCALGLVRESLLAEPTPVLPVEVEHYGLGALIPRSSARPSIGTPRGPFDVAMSCAVTLYCKASDLALDLDRPEVCDHLARVVGLRDATLTWGFATWHTQDHEQRQQIRDDTLHLLRLVDIARAVGLDPQPGERLTLERCTGTPPGHADRCWCLLVSGRRRYFDATAVPANVAGHASIPALAGITDPHEAAGIIWEVTP